MPFAALLHQSRNDPAGKDPSGLTRWLQLIYLYTCSSQTVESIGKVDCNWLFAVWNDYAVTLHYKMHQRRSWCWCPNVVARGTGKIAPEKVEDAVRDSEFILSRRLLLTYCASDERLRLFQGESICTLWTHGTWSAHKHKVWKQGPFWIPHLVLKCQQLYFIVDHILTVKDERIFEILLNSKNSKNSLWHPLCNRLFSLWLVRGLKRMGFWKMTTT